MTSVSNEASTPRRSKWRTAMLLFLFVVIAALIVGLTVWLVRPKQVVATALFQVDWSRPILLAVVAPSVVDQDYEGLKKTQVALLQSNFVLTAAVRDPGIASLSIFAGEGDPVEWLQNHLQIGYPREGQLLAISLSGSEEESEDLVHVVNAVAKAYKDEVLDEQRQNTLVARDVLDRSLNDLNEDIARKSDEVANLANADPASEVVNNQEVRLLDIIRLDRIETELSRLQEQKLDETSNAKTTDAIASHVAELQKQQSDLQKRITTDRNLNSKLSNRQRELEQLHSIADELLVKLRKTDIEIKAPDRIRQVQPAVIGDGKEWHSRK